MVLNIAVSVHWGHELTETNYGHYNVCNGREANSAQLTYSSVAETIICYVLPEGCGVSPTGMAGEVKKWQKGERCESSGVSISIGDAGIQAMGQTQAAG